MQRLLDRGISTRRGIMAIHREAPYCDPRWDAQLPQTNLATDNSIILPLYHSMTDEEHDYVTSSIEAVVFASHC
jgi:dTDP-4-amino-4,6-dideoxygalactose transaminase